MLLFVSKLTYPEHNLEYAGTTQKENNTEYNRLIVCSKQKIGLFFLYLHNLHVDMM